MTKFLVLFALLTSCASDESGESKAKNLDIPLENEKATQKPKTQPKKVDKPRDSKIKHVKTKENVVPKFEWEAFFQKPPSPQEKPLLTKKLRFFGATDKIETLYKKARTERILGRYKEAELTYRSILRKSDQSFEAYLELAQVYLSTHKIELAMDYLTGAKQILDSLETIPKEVIFNYKQTLAITLVDSGHYVEGQKILRSLIKNEPTFVPAYAALAQSYILRGRLKSATFIAKRGLDQKPNHPTLYNTLAVINIKRGNAAKARVHLRKALKQNPRFVPALINRANLAFNRKEYQAAENDLQKAIIIEPFNSEAHVSLGVLQKATGQYRKAQASFLMALDHDPEDAHARYNLALLTANYLKEPNEALRLFHEVLQTESSSKKLKNLAKLHIDGLRETRILSQN